MCARAGTDRRPPGARGVPCRGDPRRAARTPPASAPPRARPAPRGRARRAGRARAGTSRGRRRRSRTRRSGAGRARPRRSDTRRSPPAPAHPPASPIAPPAPRPAKSSLPPRWPARTNRSRRYAVSLPLVLMPCLRSLVGGGRRGTLTPGIAAARLPLSPSEERGMIRRRVCSSGDLLRSGRARSSSWSSCWWVLRSPGGRG